MTAGLIKACFLSNIYYEVAMWLWGRILIRCYIVYFFNGNTINYVGKSYNNNIFLIGRIYCNRLQLSE